MRDSELYVAVAPAVPNQGRLPSCQSPGCLERARFSIAAERFTYPSGVKTELLRARYCERHLRKAGPQVGCAFIDAAIFTLLDDGKAAS